MIWHDAQVHSMLDVSIPFVNAPQIGQAGFTGKGINVGIVDMGIDPNHPGLAGQIAQMNDFTGEGVSDNLGHGTHVARIIGGTGAASGGKYRGDVNHSSASDTSMATPHATGTSRYYCRQSQGSRLSK